MYLNKNFYSVMHMKYKPISILVCVMELQNLVHLTKFGNVNFYPICKIAMCGRMYPCVVFQDIILIDIISVVFGSFKKLVTVGCV